MHWNVLLPDHHVYHHCRNCRPLHAGGITTIKTAADATEALRPQAGDFAYLFFAAGIIGTGLLAIPVLAGSSAYAVAETLGLKEGGGKKPGRAPEFYAVISASTLIDMSFNWLGINPIMALYYTAALNGLVAPPLIALVSYDQEQKRRHGSVCQLESE